MKIFDVFPNPIFRETYSENAGVKSSIVKMMEGTDMEKNSISDNLYHFDNIRGKSFLHRDEFTDLRIWMEDQCTIFVRDVMGYQLPEKMIVTDSWLNICNAGGQHEPQRHAGL